MTTLIFVHGTGDRFENVQRTAGLIATKLHGAFPVQPCFWGDIHGYDLRAGGISIPEYQPPSGDGRARVLGFAPAVPAKVSNNEVLIDLWGLLDLDPLTELRLLAAALPDGAPISLDRTPAADALAARLAALDPLALPEEIRVRFAEGGILITLPAAVTLVRDAEVTARALDHMPADATESYTRAFARAIVAAAQNAAELQGDEPRTGADAALRDELVQLLVDELSEVGALGLPPLNELGSEVLARLLTDPLRQWRGRLTGWALGFAGDILVYQGQGALVRDTIRTAVQAAEPPVVLLAHSLGGIACADLLLGEDLREQVALLITVGTQAPLFYEMGALQKLSYTPEPRWPAFMPPWLNILDYRDFLSFQGEPVFNVGRRRIRDLVVNNRQPFPKAHGAYWHNPEVWEHIENALANPGGVLV